jgi:peptidoglycan/xylan/chitin deacetylase (PgdA/CDA1 family)
MTEPSPWSRFDQESSQRREERRVAAAKAREKRRLYIVIALVVVLLIALAGLLWPRGGDAAVRGRGVLAVPLVAPLLHPAKPATAGGTSGPPPASLGPASGKPSTKPVPILMYHVIHSPPAGAKFPDLYVPPAEFDAQVKALQDAGYKGVTLDQVESAWAKGTPLPAKPIVLSFDDGYRSQYAKARPTLQRAGWPGVLNLKVDQKPEEGNLTESQIRGLIDAGWEVDAHTITHPDLTTLDAAQLEQEVAGSRKDIQQRYGVPVNWFCYPAGRYDETVEAAVKAAGYEGATTTQPGWATPDEDRFRLPRIRVSTGTSPDALLAQITGDKGAAPPGPSFTGGGGGA